MTHLENILIICISVLMCFSLIVSLITYIFTKKSNKHNSNKKTNNVSDIKEIIEMQFYMIKEERDNGLVYPDMPYYDQIKLATQGFNNYKQKNKTTICENYIYG